jgi:hypothetical protein
MKWITAAQKRKGTVYFVQEGDERGPVKIGFTSKEDVNQRMANMATGNSRHLRLLGKIRGGRIREKNLHRRFASQRIRGEWFSWSKELAAFIQGATSATK